MKRREAIKRTTILLGGTLSMAAMTGVMSGCKADPVIDWTPRFFTPEEGSIIEQVAERIIPRTDTPGAIDAGVHVFIDEMMDGFYPEEEKTAFRDTLKKVDDDARSTYGNSFTALKPEEQDALLTRYEQGDPEKDQGYFFRTMKELTILGFCTSEAGATEALKYDPLPGDYKGCIPYEEVGGVWATR